jgi:hypothetical protein
MKAQKHPERQQQHRQWLMERNETKMDWWDLPTVSGMRQRLLLLLTIGIVVLKLASGNAR